MVPLVLSDLTVRVIDLATIVPRLEVVGELHLLEHITLLAVR